MNQCRLDRNVAELIVSNQVGTRVEVLAINQYYTTDLLYQVKYKVVGEDKVQETTVSEIDILNLKRC